MESPTQQVVPRGIVAGVVGAATLAIWFFFVDGSRGELLATPAFLARTVLGMGTGEPAFAPIAAYSVVHGVVFVAVGVAVSWLVHRVGDLPTVLLAIVLGFALFALVGYTGLVVSSFDVIGELEWPAVLAGNMLASGGIIGYLHLVGATRPLRWWDIPWNNRILQEAAVSGLVGAAVVAVWFLLIDFALGRPLFTPAALGSALFLGASEIGQVRVNFATVAGYSVFHIAAFVAMGAIASAIATVAEERPPLTLLAAFLFVVFEVVFMGYLLMGVDFLLGAFQWWAVALGNLLAAAAMGAYLWAKHPKLREAMRDEPLDRAY